MGKAIDSDWRARDVGGSGLRGQGGCAAAQRGVDTEATVRCH